MTYFTTQTMGLGDQGVLLVTADRDSLLSEDDLRGSRRELAELDSSARIVLDLSRLKHVGSPSMGALIQLHKRVHRSGGRLCLCGPSPALLEEMVVLRLDRLFQREYSLADAFDAVLG